MHLPKTAETLRSLFAPRPADPDETKEAALPPAPAFGAAPAPKPWDTTGMDTHAAQAHLWNIYKNGMGPVGNGLPDPGDKQVRGELMGHFEGYMHDAANRYQGDVYPGEAHRYVRETIYRSFDRFDPIHGSKLSSFVHDQVFPRNNPNGSIVQRLVAQHKNYKATTMDRHADFGTYRKAIESFKEEHGRTPSNQELADRTGIPLVKIIKLRHDGANEYDTHRAIDEDLLTPDLSLHERDAIMTTYASMNAVDQKILEHTLPEIFGGEAIPENLRRRGSGKWLSQKLGLGEYYISRRRKAIGNKIKSLIRE